MATVLAVLTSGRKKGFTADLLSKAAEGASSVRGVTVHAVHTHDHTFAPCTSCFECIRDERHTCVLDDDMGKRGDGEMFAMLREANGLIVADPVHNWGPSASARLLVERCYPFIWSGQLRGMPAGTLSCASNQGMQLLARRELCKWLFGLRARYMGGVAAHVACMDAAREEALELGETIAKAALNDRRKGRNAWEDTDCFAHYQQKAPWQPLEPYIENLTLGAMRAEESIMISALAEGVFTDPGAAEQAELAQVEFARTVTLYHIGENVVAANSLVRASAHWTQATWRQFLQDDVIKAPPPADYRPLPPGEEDGK